jgi:FixJ family two-component response regulator
MLLTPVRVLVIDDDDGVCRRLGGWLREAAFDVVAFTNAEEGLAHVRQAPCQLAIVDLLLGVTLGTDVIAQLRALAVPPRVIALAAFPEVKQVRAAMHAGATELLEKPVQREALLGAVEHELAQLGLWPRAEEELNRRVGARLRALRTAADRTLNDLAAECGLTAAQLSQIELGKSATTTWSLARICGALRLPLQRFFAEF